MPPYIPGVMRRELLRILRRLNFSESGIGDYLNSSGGPSAKSSGLTDT